MNILQVNLSDTIGGAARISWYLFRQYQQRGHDSYLAVDRKASGDPNVFEIPNDRLRNRCRILALCGEGPQFASHPSVTRFGTLACKRRRTTPLARARKE